MVVERRWPLCSWNRWGKWGYQLLKRPVWSCPVKPRTGFYAMTYKAPVEIFQAKFIFNLSVGCGALQWRWAWFLPPTVLPLDDCLHHHQCGPWFQLPWSEKCQASHFLTRLIKHFLSSHVMIICILAYGWADLMFFQTFRGGWRGCWRHVKLIKAHGSKSSLCLVNTCCRRQWHWRRSVIQGSVREIWSGLCDYACLAVITTEVSLGKLLSGLYSALPHPCWLMMSCFIILL